MPAKKSSKQAKSIVRRERAASSNQDLFPVVAIGASAGGLEAVIELLKHVPEEPRAAFVYVHHADPAHQSSLRQILERSTKMTVVDVEQRTAVARDTVYVIPGGMAASITHGVIDLHDLPKRQPKMPIDYFFRALADDQGSRAISVVLSGSASDGALGTKAIKAEGGITFAQDDSAHFDSMPRSAVATGHVDFVLSPSQIAKEIARIAVHSYVSADEGGPQGMSEPHLAAIFALLQTTHDVDFTHYKPNTVERRIRRRMALSKMESLDDYISFLRGHPEEVDRLYTDLLIRVTGFFRDPEVFEALRADVFPALMRNRAEDSPLRIWVPGCATGEEVYSIAICAIETISAAGVSCPVQVFGTDVSDPAVEAARAGMYPENIAAELSPERLRRFFNKIDGMYRVSKSVRDCCVFARQNVTKDPPFSKLDLVSCRNVMIYLGTVLQQRVMSIFHYALRPEAFLLLGSSETVGTVSDLFSVVDRKHKIYRKRSVAGRVQVDFQAAVSRERAPRRGAEEEELIAASTIYREADRVLLTRFSPAGVLVNDSLEIVQFRGRTSPFLEPAPGTASFSLMKMAREGLLAELRTALHNAKKKNAAVRRENIRIKNNGKSIMANIEVLPVLSAEKERFFLVMFEQARPEPEVPSKKGAAARGKDDQKLLGMKRELDATREYLQSIIEEQEAMNEELRSANEEIQSSNEELQSTNEELETAKEELQSSNEELTTLNEELENRNEELAQAHNDMVNLLSSVDIPIVMLDEGLRIRRFNPGAQRVFNIIASDIGRSIHDLKLTLKIDNLDGVVGEVIEDLKVREMEVQDRDGRWYSLRVRPYRTTENKIEGAVMVLIDLPKKQT
jgi:two-component system CheB/CheR fusion protein